MEFYVIKEEYINYLKEYETMYRGVTKVPDITYRDHVKLAVGVVLEVNTIPYYVMISSFCKKQEANLLIRVRGDRNEVKGSLRFNYMLPVPKSCLSQFNIRKVENEKYRDLLNKEYRFCKNNETLITEKANQVYDLVVKRKKSVLVANSCEFNLLEKAYFEYIANRIIDG